MHTKYLIVINQIEKSTGSGRNPLFDYESSLHCSDMIDSATCL